MTPEELLQQNTKSQVDSWLLNSKMEARKLAIRIATDNNMFINDIDRFLEEAEKIYSWLMQDTTNLNF